MNRALSVVAIGTLASALVAPTSTPPHPAVVAGRERAGQSAPPQAAPAFNSALSWRHLDALVKLGPRPAGSAAIRQARAYITRQLAELKLVVQEQPFIAETPLGPIEMVNLVVRLPGRRQERVLFTGHYDTKLFRDRVFVGASDGGSSAAFLIELARVLSTAPREFTYDLVWFDGEEAVVAWQGNDHTYGSRYYVQAARQAGALASIRAMVLVDMIGDHDLTIRRDTASTSWLTSTIWSAAERLGHGAVFLDEETRIEDDHIPFLEAGVPSVDIIDLDYAAWHTPADTMDEVSPKSLQIVGDVLLAALPDIERRLIAGER